MLHTGTAALQLTYLLLRQNKHMMLQEIHFCFGTSLGEIKKTGILKGCKRAILRD